jgi:hypothetical protein
MMFHNERVNIQNRSRGQSTPERIEPAKKLLHVPRVIANCHRGQSSLVMEESREILNHGRIAGSFDFGSLKTAKKSQPVLGHLNE